jgi:hypothetical protein
MRKPNAVLFKIINQHSHALTRQAYEETRNALRARALQLIKEGAPQDQVIQAIVSATIRQTLKA